VNIQDPENPQKTVYIDKQGSYEESEHFIRESEHYIEESEHFYCSTNQ
jgi:hypothetical protein